VTRDTAVRHHSRVIAERYSLPDSGPFSFA
jgi:hypothetical protein